jgi:hypothetical protein
MGFISRKKIAAAAAIATVGVGGVVAYAYWTTTGSGSGTATAQSSNGTVTLHANIADASSLYPGGSAAVAFTADNDGATNLYVGTITVKSITTSDTHCLATDFSMDASTYAENTEVAHNTDGVSLPLGGTLSFANSDVSQEACKGATITVNVTSN